MTATIPVKEGVLTDLNTKLVDIAAKIKDQDEELKVSGRVVSVSLPTAHEMHRIYAISTP